MKMINRYDIRIVGDYDYDTKMVVEVDHTGDWLDREEVLFYLREVLQDTISDDTSGYGNHRISEMGLEALKILCQKLS
jgi:hypothetical protein